MNAKPESLEEAVREWLRLYSFHEVIDSGRNLYLPDSCKQFFGGNARKAIVQMRGLKVNVCVLETMPTCTISTNQMARKPQHSLLRWFHNLVTTFERTKVHCDAFLPFKHQPGENKTQQRMIVVREDDMYHGYCVQQVLEYEVADLRGSTTLFV